jgi:excisionase family DNA binding protein
MLASTNTHPPVSSPPGDDDPFLTTDEAAAICRLHPQTLREAYRAGRLRGVKVNGARVLRFRRSWLHQWLQG